MLNCEELFRKIVCCIGILYLDHNILFVGQFRRVTHNSHTQSTLGRVLPSQRQPTSLQLPTFKQCPNIDQWCDETISGHHGVNNPVQTLQKAVCPKVLKHSMKVIQNRRENSICFAFGYFPGHWTEREKFALHSENMGFLCYELILS